MIVGGGCSASPPWCVSVTFTPTREPATFSIGSISDATAGRRCATGVGMLETHMMIVENNTPVMARIRIVPTTSEIPDSSSRKTTFIEGPPGGRERIMFAAGPTIFKVFAVVTTTAKPLEGFRACFRASLMNDPLGTGHKEGPDS